MSHLPISSTAVEHIVVASQDTFEVVASEMGVTADPETDTGRPTTKFVWSTLNEIDNTTSIICNGVNEGGPGASNECYHLNVDTMTFTLLPSVLVCF